MVLRMTITGAPAVRRERAADLLADALDVLQVDAAVRQAGRADADEDEVADAHRVGDVAGRPQAAARRPALR
jgi:hypothetical protein